MRIIHRISISSSPEIRGELATLGVVVGASGLVTFEVDETHAAWPSLRLWISRRKAADIVSTKFSKKELAEASWLVLEPNWHCGYPQPNEERFGYRDATYARTGFCEKCGLGLEQKALFQMKSEPKWGRNGILQLHWVFDEFFVTPEVWSTVFNPNGVGCRPVLDPQGMELKTVVQLVIHEEVGVAVEGLASERCTRCERLKYLPISRGAFPRLVNTPSVGMVKTREYFGSGASAHRSVLVSREVAWTLAEKKVRGAAVRPVG
ncbi:hypothetical protein [Melittangium boletus]|uniref:Uncharacterized protein n=1 Tax=Melittangium boletus DSM 14713 TaxID=1294270 RepID=A0A250IP14_9BACT|nr:hypothetical protein [Melittangium boletus]ATB32990.1 hypothetical protein MEBOL_006479 [Melittangium boletus DSM 14713]